MLKVPWSEKSLEPLLQSSWPTCRKKYAFLSFTCSPNTRSRHRIAFKSWCISLFSWILIGFDNFNFELLRNFQFSFWTTDYCIEKFGSVEFLKSVGIVHCVCSKCWTLTITIWYKSPLLRRRSQGAQGAIPSKLLAYLVILCFEKQRPKQKYCCSHKVKHFGPTKILGWLRHCSLMYHVIKVTEFVWLSWIQSLFLTHHCYSYRDTYTS